MIALRKAEDRGSADHGWLDTRFSFSFADYHDPAHMGFRALRVINEDRIAPGGGFPTHPHRDMEILTYVVEGQLEHQDSMGNGSVIVPGEVQRMTAGTGVRHSEFNPSPDQPLHLLQIWILPRERGLEPSYEQRRFEEVRNTLQRVASPDGRDGAVTIHQDASLFAARLDPGHTVEHVPAPGRHVWVQVVRGRVLLNGQPLAAGDGAGLSDEPRVTLEAVEDTELLLFDLA